MPYLFGPNVPLELLDITVDSFNYLTFLDIEVPKKFSCKEEEEYYKKLRETQLSTYNSYFIDHNRPSARIQKYIAWKRDNELRVFPRFLYHVVGMTLRIFTWYNNTKALSYGKPIGENRGGFVEAVGEQYTHTQVARFFAQYYFSPVASILFLLYFARLGGCM